MEAQEKQLKKNPSNKSFYTLDKPLVPYKAHYFLLSGAHVGVIPYLPVYAKTVLGCSATTVGLLATCMQLSSTISRPLFGLLADCLNQMKILMATLLCLEVIVNLLMLALPPVNVSKPETPYGHPIDSSHILRFAPARVYDASVGLHIQSRIIPHNMPSFTFLDRLRRNDTANKLQLSFNRTHSDVVLLKKHRRNLDFLAAPCDLTCSELIFDAMCYQNDTQCMNMYSNNTMECTLRQGSYIPFCENFEDETNFSMTFRVQPKSYHTKYLSLKPQKLVYYRIHGNHSVPTLCNVTIDECNLRCDIIQDCAPSDHDGTVLKTYQFWIFCLFALLGSMCQGAAYTLSDTACYEKMRESRADFGRQRLWGAIGWGVIAPLTGFLNDLASGRAVHEDYSSGWYIMAIMSFFLLMNLFCMDFPVSAQSVNMWNDVKGVVADRSFIFMEINVFLLGILNAYATNYVIWYMELLGSSRIAMGLALGVECLFGEAPFMYFSGFLMTYVGHWNIVTLSFAAFAARFGIYYFIENPWWVLPVELLNGITFGLFYTMITSFAEKIAPAGTEATIQGIIGGTYLGLGSGIGCLVAGISFDKFGGRRSFLLAAIMSAVLAILHALICLIFNPRNKDAQILQEEDRP